MDGSGVETIHFDEVANTRGFWMRVSQLKQLFDEPEAFSEPMPRRRVSFIKALALQDNGLPPHQRTARYHLSTFANLVIFDNLFIDKRAFFNAGLNEHTIPSIFGSLSPHVRLVQIDDDIYKDAADYVNECVKFIQKGPGTSLAELYFPQEELTRLTESDLESLFDSMFPRLNVHERFFNTGSSLERLFVYFELQRRSGAPVQLSQSTEMFIEKYPTVLRSIILSLCRNPQGEVEEEVSEVARKHARWKEEVTVPPIIDLILRKIESSKKSINVAEAAKHVRESKGVEKYRKWLWDYICARAKGDELKAQKMLESLGGHVEAMREKGGHTWFTGGRIPFTIAAGIGSLRVTMPSGGRWPRWTADDYVCFVGRWFSGDSGMAE